MPGLIELEKLRRNKKGICQPHKVIKEKVGTPNEFATKTVPEDILIDILFLRRR